MARASDPYRVQAPHIHYILSTAESFRKWIDCPDNQPLYSVQEAYERWLRVEGFDRTGGSYSMAVAVILVYLSQALAYPPHRRYRCGPADQLEAEYAVLPVWAPPPYPSDDMMFWEFLSEERYKAAYARWRSENRPS